jgi:predicted phosphodiesterase
MSRVLKKKGAFLAFGCNHGDLLDEKCFEKLINFKEEVQPEHVIHLGDAFEFTALRKNASPKELDFSVDQDIDWGLYAMEEAFSGAKTKIYLRGNHCERLWKMAESDTQVGREWAEGKIARIEEFLKKNDIKMLPYCSHAGVQQINDTLFMHGTLFGMNAARDHLRAYHKDVIFVHTHRAEDVTIPGWPNPLNAINAGCTRELLPEYAQRTVSTLGWKHACAYGEFHKDGTSTKYLKKF